ncbi:MAG TPA: zf-HC2 domain-containing protein [Pyrinomonadaceae bacterium]
MTSDDADICTCGNEEIAAYLDGELDSAAHSSFEQHVKECSSCAEQLREQKRLICALDFALGGEAALPLPPADFAHIVAARAQSDMRGLRAHAEHKRALFLCVGLAIISALLIGGAVALNESVLAPLQAMMKPVATVIGFLLHTLYNAGAGLAIISRVGGHLLFESRPLGLLGCLLLIAALALLPRLIINYHRARIT